LKLDAECAPNLTHWRGMLNAEETARADRFHFAADRDSFIGAHALARAMLSDATGLGTEVWQFQSGAFGKPAIAGEQAKTGLQFSISHTRGCAACTIACHDVGVDVETAGRDADLGVARRFFAPEECALLCDQSETRRPALFFRIWTLKEAFIKATGEGLHRPLESFSFAFAPLRIRFHPQRPSDDEPDHWQFAQFDAAPHFPVAVAVRRPPQCALWFDARPALPGEIAAG
jgi:4'-phosphopantetheinyl transferase